MSTKCLGQYLVVTKVSGTVSMQQHSSVLCFVVARGEQGKVLQRWLDQGYVYTSDKHLFSILVKLLKDSF